MLESRNPANRLNEPPLADPLAFFMTWSTYGTWLPGDERGWVKYHHGFQQPDPLLNLEAEASMTEDACVLDDEQRQLVHKTIADHCRIRGWVLHAVNCRTNHLHIVVSASRDPDEMREQFKAWCTRKLKELERKRSGAATPVREHWWAERGSCRWIDNEASLEAAIHYVHDQ